MWGSALWGGPGQCTRRLHRWRDSLRGGPRNGHSQRRLKHRRISLETEHHHQLLSLTWHRRVAGQEQRPALLEDSCEPVTDRVNSEVRPIVAHTNNYRGLASLGWNKVDFMFIHSQSPRPAWTSTTFMGKSNWNIQINDTIFESKNITPEVSDHNCSQWVCGKVIDCEYNPIPLSWEKRWI